MSPSVIDATTEFDKSARPRLIQGLSNVANLCHAMLEIEDAEASNSMLSLCAIPATSPPVPSVAAGTIVPV